MPRRVDIPLADLLLDRQNARLGQEQPDQQSTAHALAAQQGRRLVKLAEDIMDKNLDPAQLPVVLATNDKRRKYIVLEGNRRVLALKALDTPSLVQSALAPADFKKLASLANKFEADPVGEVFCVLYDAEEAQRAYDFVANRHGGARDGAGLVEWDADEKDRFLSRHGGRGLRNYAGQVLDFLSEVDGPNSSKTRIATNVQRLLKTTHVQEKLGLEVVDGVLVSHYPKDQVSKGLRKIADDLRSGRIKVPNIYHDEQRKDYIDGFKKAELPDPREKLAQPVRLTELPSGRATPVKPKGKPKPKPPRTTVAASDAKLNPGPPRINAIYNELVGLSADSNPNAGAVLLRVFLELTVDDYLERRSLMSDEQRRNLPLAKRLKTVNADLFQTGGIGSSLRDAIEKVANSQHGLSAGMTTFNQYVHNQYSYPKPTELRTMWDELQPFLEAVWK